ncbi:MAG: sulfur carrier protein ThiS [Alphaproteobacteria bacterium]|nr:sulfur carrier protein ThiS [Alphaproteobacteria bacterium]
MKVTVNGTVYKFGAPLNLYDVLEQQGFIEMMIAVARNGTFVPREGYRDIALQEGDEIEIVAPMQGG